MAQDLKFDIELQLREANRKLDQLQEKSQDVGQTSGKGFGKKFAAAAGSILGAISFSGMVGGFKSLTGVATTVEEQMANVSKTTGITGDKLETLEESLFEISRTSNTSTDELREIAEETGRLGVKGSKDILSFTDAINKISVALGDEFTGGAKEVTKEVATLSRVLKGVEGESRKEELLLMGNAINALGNNTKATVPKLTNFSGRIGGLAPSLGAKNILGVSAALEQLGVEAERGSSGVGRAVGIMGEALSNLDSKEAKAIADHLGMTTEAAADLVNTNPNKAFIELSKSIAGSGKATTEIQKELKELSITGVGVQEVVKKVGRNSELVTKNQKLAADALTNTNSIMGEYETKNTTTAAKIQKLKNRNQELKNSFGEALIPIMHLFLSAVTPVVTKVSEFVEQNPVLARNIMIAVAAITAIITVVLGAIVVFGVIASSITSITTLIGGGGGLMAMFTALTGPIGLAVAAVVGVIAIFGTLMAKSKAFRTFVTDQIAKVIDFFNIFEGNVAENVGKIVGFFVTLPIKLPILMGKAVVALTKKITEVDWGGIWNNIVTAFKDIDWRALGSQILDGIKAGFSGLGHFFRGAVKGAVAGLPGGQSLLDKLGFQSGGFTGVGRDGEVAGNVHKNETVLNPKQMSGLIMQMAEMGSRSETNNNTTNNYGVDFGSPFTPAPFRMI